MAAARACAERDSPKYVASHPFRSFLFEKQAERMGLGVLVGEKS